MHGWTRNPEVSGTGGKRDTCEETKEAIVSPTGPGPHPAGFHENKAANERESWQRARRRAREAESPNKSAKTAEICCHAGPGDQKILFKS